MGTTRRTDTEIENFNQEFKQRNQLYRGLSANCQFYVVELVGFTLAKGHRYRDLPPPESLWTSLVMYE